MTHGSFSKDNLKKCAWFYMLLSVMLIAASETTYVLSRSDILEIARDQPYFLEMSDGMLKSGWVDQIAGKEKTAKEITAVLELAVNKACHKNPQNAKLFVQSKQTILKQLLAHKEKSQESALQKLRQAWGSKL